MKQKAIRGGANDYVREVLRSLVDDIENTKNSAIETLGSLYSKNISEISNFYDDISYKIKNDLDKIK